MLLHNLLLLNYYILKIFEGERKWQEKPKFEHCQWLSNNSCRCFLFISLIFRKVFNQVAENIFSEVFDFAFQIGPRKMRGLLYHLLVCVYEAIYAAHYKFQPVTSAADILRKWLGNETFKSRMIVKFHGSSKYQFFTLGAWSGAGSPALILMIPVKRTSSSLNPFGSVFSAASRILIAVWRDIRLHGPVQNSGSQWPLAHWSVVTLYLPQRKGRAWEPL